MRIIQMYEKRMNELKIKTCLDEANRGGSLKYKRQYMNQGVDTMKTRFTRWEGYGEVY